MRSCALFVCFKLDSVIEALTCNVFQLQMSACRCNSRTVNVLWNVNMSSIQKVICSFCFFVRDFWPQGYNTRPTSRSFNRIISSCSFTCPAETEQNRQIPIPIIYYTRTHTVYCAYCLQSGYCFFSNPVCWNIESKQRKTGLACHLDCMIHLSDG